MDPINYSIDVPNPTQSFMQGMQSGVAVNQIQQQQAAQQAAQARQQKMNADLAALAKNPTTEGIIQASITYPELTEAHKRTFDMLAPQEQEAKVNAMIPIYAAMKKGRMDIASNMLNEQADALQNSGKTQEAAQTRAHAQAALDHPEILDLQSSLLLSQAMGADKYKSLNDSLIAQQKAPSEVSVSEAEAKIKGAEALATPQTIALKNADILSQINTRSGQLNLDKDKLHQDTAIKLADMNQKLSALPEAVTKDINTAVTESTAYDQSADKLIELSSRIDAAKNELHTGNAARIAEAYKNFSGYQNEVSQIRNDYDRYVTPAALAAYKQVASGSTSDKDIDTAMKGIPSNVSDPEILSSYLQGVAKLQVYNSALNEGKSEWLAEVKYLGKTKKDININGIDVPAGTTFAQFSKDYLPKKVSEIYAQKGLKITHNRGYQNVPPASDIPTAPLSNGWSITPIGGK